MTQLSLFGDPPAPPERPKPTAWPRGSDRLILAFYPDPAVIEGVVRQGAALRAEHRLTGRPRPREILHITLRHVGDFVGPPPQVVAALTAALSDFAFPAFEIVLDATMRFAGSRAFVLLAREALNPQLIAFQRALCERLDGAGAGWRVGGAGFTPHLTLSYEDRDVEQSIAPIAWTAREFVLTHSLVGQTRHLPVSRFTLD